MSFRTRNVDYIRSKEVEFFKELGMTKIGYEGFEPTVMTGGKVWYIACFPNTPEEQHTIAVESWFGNLRQTYQRWLNPRMQKND